MKTPGDQPSPRQLLAQGAEQANPLQDRGACCLHPRAVSPSLMTPGTSPAEGPGPLRARGSVREKEGLVGPRLAPGQPVLGPRDPGCLAHPIP